MAQINFDASKAPDNTYSPVPPGEYKVAVQESELKPTKDGKGKRLVLKFLILDGQYKGRNILEGYNYENPSVEAQNISRAQLKEMTVAIFGEPKVVRDSLEWHMKPLLIDVDIEPGKDGYDPRNIIKKYRRAPSTGGIERTRLAPPPEVDVDNDEMPSW